MKPGAKPAPVARRVKASMVEITIVGVATEHVGDALAHCVHLASQGKSATIKAPGITATVKVTQ